MKFKPLLADSVDFNLLDFNNLWLSAKLDGIRAIIIDGVVMSRSLKPIPNQHVQAVLGNRPELEGFDGELGVGDPTAKDFYLSTYSGVMKKTGEPDVTLHAFDHISNPCDFYHVRHARLTAKPSLQGVQVVTQHGCESMEALLDLEQWYLGKGYEGVMLRAHSGPASFYKYGRSTAREGTLMKLKRFTDAEALVVGYEEEMQNNNDATTDALGRTKRSTCQENKLGKGRLGALVCVTPEGVKFNIGTGFDATTRQKLWDEYASLPGRIAKYKSFVIGAKDAPRFPVFLGWRDPIDISV